MIDLVIVNGCLEGVHHVGEDDFVEKQYIKPKPKSVFDSMLKMFKIKNLWVSLAVFYMINHTINIFMKEIIFKP